MASFEVTSGPFQWKYKTLVQIKLADILPRILHLLRCSHNFDQK